MTHEILRTLITTSVALTLSVSTVVLLSKSFRAGFGAQIAYALWIVVPISLVIALLPAPMRPLTTRVSAPAFDGMRASASSHEHAPPSIDLQAYSILVWIGGVFLSIALLARQQRRFVRALGFLRHEADGTLRSETGVGCPALLGLFRPVIVLPADFERQYTGDERDLILAHETVHLRRGDVHANALVAAARCVFWFHPLVHIAAQRFHIDQEMACDAGVIAQFPTRRQAYARAMLRAQRVENYALLGCQWPSHPIKERITMLQYPLPTRRSKACGVVLAAVLLSAASYAAWAVQPGRAAPVDDDWRTKLDNFAPKGVSVDAVHMDGVLLKITGDATSSDKIARFVHDLAESPRLSNVDLKSVTEADGRFHYEISASRLQGEAKLSDKNAAGIGEALKGTLQHLAPSGVIVTNVSVASDGKIQVAGTADSAQTVDAFTAKIEQIKIFDAASHVSTAPGQKQSVAFELGSWIRIVNAGL